MSESTIAAYHQLFVGGEWVTPHSGRLIQSVDPSSGEIWAEVAEADGVDVDRAVEAAAAAFHGPWRQLTASERGDRLFALAGLLRARSSELATAESRDNGKPLTDTTGEIGRAADWLQYYAGAADKIQGSTIPLRPTALAYTLREPVGVVAAITPWNSPIYLYAWKLGPALAAGNTVVLKPAEQTSVSAQILADLIREAGFPPGVVNIVPGYGAVAGRHLTSHPGVNKIAFTGAHSTAIAILREAAASMKRVTCECGGKAPHIIFEDADIESAAAVAVHSAFRSTGQSCAAGSRLFVQSLIYDDFLLAVSKLTKRIRVGPALDSRTHIGPQTSQEQLEKTLRYIALGKSEGSRLVGGGDRPSGSELRQGFYVNPTIFADVDNRSPLAQEEIFGPVLSVIRFETEEDAVGMANDTKYGLVAGLWTRDISRAHRVAHRLEAGFVSINTFRPVHWTLPYGGVKMSGIGRENGLEALHQYTEVKTVVVDLSGQPGPDPFAR